MIAKALAAEFLGSFAWVAAVCAATMLGVPSGGGPLEIALATGLAVTAMTAAFAHVSGAHFNPAVTIGLMAGGRFTSSGAVGYVLAQVLGALAAAAFVQAVLGGAMAAGPGATTRWNDISVAANAFGQPRGFSMISALLAEAVLAFLLVVVVMGVTAAKAPAGLAALAIGAAVTLLHLIAMPVTNAALNPARATATAVLAGGTPLAQLWLFWVAPILGGFIGGALARWLESE